jgi:glycosyltransferase involved in cell wall biosynthesis
MIAETGGGILHRPHDPTDIANKLVDLLRESEKAIKLGIAGQNAVRDRYHAAVMAEKTRELYLGLTRR